jgi:hypothetical protein
MGQTHQSTVGQAQGGFFCRIETTKINLRTIYPNVGPESISRFSDALHCEKEGFNA